MSNIKKKVWSTQDSWRSLAFTEFGDSREWRFLLELNPSYDIRYQPAAGTVININGPLSEGKVTPSGMGRVGVLIQPDLAADFRTAETTSENGQPSVFPWDSPVDYLDRLGQYTALSLLTLDRTNGFCLDSPQASRDTQRG